jgi:hypothetical protein
MRRTRRRTNRSGRLGNQSSRGSSRASGDWSWTRAARRGPPNRCSRPEVGTTVTRPSRATGTTRNPLRAATSLSARTVGVADAGTMNVPMSNSDSRVTDTAMVLRCSSRRSPTSCHVILVLSECRSPFGRFSLARFATAPISRLPEEVRKDRRQTRPPPRRRTRAHQRFAATPGRSRGRW